MERVNGRDLDAVRQLSVVHGICGHAAGSTLFSMGATTVIAAVSLQPGVPPFLRGKRVGWLTAEYAMLPAATQVRSSRESTALQRSGRSVEISRLIGRVFRSITDLSALGDRTIYIDCDVLHADGGTRCAAINGAYLALCAAQQRWLEEGVIRKPIMREEIAAVSIGIVAGKVIVDLDYGEDALATADINFVATRSGKMIEVQGTSEREPVSWHDIVTAQSYAQQSIQTIIAWFDQVQRFDIASCGQGVPIGTGMKVVL